MSRICRAIWQDLLQLSELFVMHDEERGGCFGDTGPDEQGCYVECAGVCGGEGGC